MYKFGAVYKDNIKINEDDTLFTCQDDHGKYGMVGEFKKMEQDTNIGSKVVLQENLDDAKYGMVGEFKKMELDTNIGSKVVLQENLDDALAYKKAMGEKYGGRNIGAHMMATSLVYTLSETAFQGSFREHQDRGGGPQARELQGQRGGREEG